MLPESGEPEGGLVYLLRYHAVNVFPRVRPTHLQTPDVPAGGG